MESNVDVPWGSAGIPVDLKPSIATSGGEETTEAVSHIGGDGSAEECEEGVDGHGDDDKGLPAERAEEVEKCGRASMSNMA